MNLIMDSPWAGPLLWVAVYTSDYFFTIAGARLCRVQDKIVFAGSFEINPLFQDDVNALRRLSPRFFLALVLSTGYLVLVRWMAGSSKGFRDVYLLVLGVMFLGEATIHMRHLRNWFLFKKAVPLIHGRLEYPRGIILKMSASEMLIFAGLYTVLYLVTGSMFVLGGALAACALAIKHYLLGRRHAAALAKAALPST